MKIHAATALASSLLAATLALAGCAADSPDVAEQSAANTEKNESCDTDAGAPNGEPKVPVVDACAAIPDGPITPLRLGQPFLGSEDFAFDGRGNIVGKRGNAVVLINTQGGLTELAALPGQVYGLRYHPNGSLVAAIPGAGKLVSVAPNGEVTDLATGLGTPNGVYVDFDGNVWVTEFGGSKVTKLGADGARSVVVSGTDLAQAANGVVLDEAKRVLFYTEYAKGKIHRVAIDEPEAAPVLVATIPGAALDGITLDACGNVYAVDQGRSRVFRVRVGADGAASAEPELLATLPTNVANAQFGAGEGFDPEMLYVTGNPGTVYALPVGVRGAPVPTAPAKAAK